MTESSNDESYKEDDKAKESREDESYKEDNKNEGSIEEDENDKTVMSMIEVEEIEGEGGDGGLTLQDIQNIKKKKVEFWEPQNKIDLWQSKFRARWAQQQQQQHSGT